MKHEHIIKLETADGLPAEITVHSRVASYGMRGQLRPIQKEATLTFNEKEASHAKRIEGMADGAEKSALIIEHQDELSATYRRSFYDQFYLIIDRTRTDKKALDIIDNRESFEDNSDLEDVSAVVTDFRARIVV